MLISIVVPMYNESEVLDTFFTTVADTLAEVDDDIEYVCVNDGSIDDTLEKLKALKSIYSNLRIINLSRNFGKESALTAGIETARGDVVIPMDADLQDPPQLILTMLEKYTQGHDVVLAKRIDRSTDGHLKRTTAAMFYKLIGGISSVNIPENVGDFRLMSRRVVDVLKGLNETQRFMKGIFSWPGFPTAVVEYTRPERAAGETRFNWRSLTNLAVEGITSFSVAPLRLSSLFGIFFSLAAFGYAIYVAIKTLVYGIDVPGYASLMVVLLFISGAQFFLIGILGEYIGRVYMEVKGRPIYVIENEY